MEIKYTPHIEKNSEGYTAMFPIMPGPTPLLSGKGNTPQEAVNQLKIKTENDPLGKVWIEYIEWEKAN